MKTKRLGLVVTLGLLGLALFMLALNAARPDFAQAADITSRLGVITVCPVGPPDCEYISVQAAVDAANAGDVIKVAAGTYTGVHARPRRDLTTTGTVTQVVYVSKTVVILGGYSTTDWATSDPQSNPTTLDAQGQGRVFYITGDISTTIAGLRITGGDATGLGGHDSRFDQPEGDGGGGVYAISATVTISGNQVFGNIASPGGGMHLYKGTALISGNTVSDNSGIALEFYSTNATISGNALTDNPGPGMELLFGVSAVRDNLIADNEGTGLYMFIHDSTVSGNTIARNTDSGVVLVACSSDGPGIKVTLINNTILSNTLAVNGGGARIEWSDAVLTNNVIADNQAHHLGSGLWIGGSSARLLHSTIARNSGGDGSAIYVTESGEYSSTVALTNTVLVSHSVGIHVTGGNTVTVDSILWHSTPITLSQSPTAVVNMQNHYLGDPAFAADGYHLTSASAAIDKGVDAGVAVDIDGETRPAGKGYDLGADEVGWWDIYLPLVVRNE